MKVPTQSEINIYNSLDEMTACDHFLNKTIEQAEMLFIENSSYYQEDLMWMGPLAFNFYLQAVIRYLKSENSTGDSHLIDCLYEIITFRMNEKEFFLAFDNVNKTVSYIIKNYDKFGVNPNIYGDLYGKFKKLYNEFKK